MVDIAATILEEIQYNKEVDIDKYISGMSDEKLNELYEKIASPYSFSLPGNHKYTNMSYTNIREDYMTKFLTTSLIGFLFRSLDEYKVPLECEPVSVEKYINNPSIVEPRDYDLKDVRKMEKINQHKEWMNHKVHIYNFLMDRFQYNPDKHVRIAYMPNPKDPERDPITTDIAKKGLRHGNSVRTKRGKMKGTRIGKLNKKKLAELRNRKKETIEEHQKKQIDLINEKYEQSSMDDEEKVAVNSDVEETETVDVEETETVDVNNKVMPLEVIPPADYFHIFNRYKDNHYDEFHKLTTDLYVEKHDIDIAFNIHEQHHTIEEADAYRYKHVDDTPYTIYTIENNGWVFTGPWEQNRERKEFLNKHTTVLEAIMENSKEDAKLSKDLVNNRVRIAKEENVREVGPDDESFLRYKMSNRPEAAKMGAVNINDPMYADNVDSDDENNDVKSTIPIVPESESLEIDVISLSRGGRDMSIGKMYTRAIAPDEDGGAMPLTQNESAELKNKPRILKN